MTSDLQDIPDGHQPFGPPERKEQREIARLLAEDERLLSTLMAKDAELAEVEDDYKSLDHAMEILRSCVSPYTGEQAQKVAKALKQWQEKWKAAVDQIFPDERQTLADLRAMLADSEADRLAIAQQVGIVYEADYCAPVAGPTDAILRAIEALKRDAADLVDLRAENERLRGRDAEPFDWDAEQTVVEWIDENLPEREPRAGSKMVELHADEVVADRGEARRVAGWLKDIMAENARLQADLAAARADQAAMARRELEALKAWVRGGVGAPLRHYVCRVPYVRQGDTVHHIDQRLAALPAQQLEPEPDAATRDGDEVLRELAQWVGGEDGYELWRAVAELCRRELGRKP